MRHINVKLTETDRTILTSYGAFLPGLSDYLGSGVEIALHSLENPEHSVIKIVNGWHSGRKEGAPITDLALSMLAKIQETGSNPYISYLNRNKENEPTKSCTIAILGEKKKIIGLVCINFYLNTPLFTCLEMLSSDTAFPTTPTETFCENIDEIISRAVISAKEEVYANDKIPISYKNKEIVSLLDEKGIFNLKDAVITVSELLDISKNTVYLHLRKKRP